jgi:mRNA interferase RelE/StbE
MPYTIKFSPHAARAFRKLPRSVQGRMHGAIEPLKENPRPQGAEMLKGSDNTYRIRVGDYRILYEIRDQELVVYVIETAHRREVYRRSK